LEKSKVVVETRSGFRYGWLGTARGGWEWSGDSKSVRQGTGCGWEFLALGKSETKQATARVGVQDFHGLVAAAVPLEHGDRRERDFEICGDKPAQLFIGEAIAQRGLDSHDEDRVLPANVFVVRGVWDDFDLKNQRNARGSIFRQPLE
jgi:hypothetical protein